MPSYLPVEQSPGNQDREKVAAVSTSIVGLYDPADDKSSCGVGFITRKDGVQTHDVLIKGREALCSVPHRGGMSSEGVGDGGGVSVDLSLRFFRKVTGRSDLRAGHFCVGNFFLPDNDAQHARAAALVERELLDRGFTTLAVRNVPVDDSAIRPAASRISFRSGSGFSRSPPLRVPSLRLSIASCTKLCSPSKPSRTTPPLHYAGCTHSRSARELRFSRVA